MSVPSRLLPMCAALLLALQASHAAAATDKAVSFDVQTLQGLGFTADLASYFSRAPRFLPGVQPVTINVNASRKYLVDATFDNDGDLCITPGLLASLRLKADGVPDGCSNIQTLWPGANVRLFPGEYRIELTVPEAAFPTQGRDDGMLRGGTAALLNYNLFAQQIQSNSNSFNYFQADLQPGFNAGSWSVRSRGVYTHGDQGSRYQQQEAYVQRPIESLHALTQLGQISSFGQTFGGLPMLGTQIGVDQAQLGATPLAVPIQGLATSQATIEVRQRGRLLYRTVVQPGPFTLAEISGMTGGVDLDVDVIEDSGQRRHFTVPALAAGRPAQQATNWSAAVGRYRSYRHESERKAPLLATGELSFNATDTIHLTSGALLSAPHQTVGAESTWSVSDAAWLTMGSRLARTQGFGSGAEVSAQGSLQLGGNLSASASWLARTQRYANATEAFESPDRLNETPRLQHAPAATVVWAHPRWGVASYTVGYNRYYANESVGNAGGGLSHNLNLARQFGPANVSLSLQKQPFQGFAAYLIFSMPLGGGSLRGNVYRDANGQLSAGTTYDGKIGPDQSYTVGVTGTEDHQRLNASTNLRTAYSQVSAGVGQSTDNARSAYGAATGSLVYVRGGGFGTSSAPVSDTFALLTVQDQAGLRVQAPGGSSKTNALGTAVIPNVLPYMRSQLQVDSRSVPLNTRLDTTTLSLGQARGSVGVYHIGASTQRQLLLTIKDAEGNPAALGASVYDESGAFMGIVVGEGNFMLTNEQIGKTLTLVGGNGNRCQISYTAPEHFDENSPYEEAEAQCR